MVLGQEEGQAKREEGGKEPVGSPWAVDGLDPPSAHAHQPSRHYFCWAWALGGVNGRSIIRRLSSLLFLPLSTANHVASSHART